MKWVWRIAIGVVVLAILAYAGGLGAMYFMQRQFQYDFSGRMLALSETKLRGAQLVYITTPDGGTITGWYERPSRSYIPLIIYFRGNTQSFSREHERFEDWVADGYGFLAFDYRGFPGSPGETTEAHVLTDSLAAFDWAATKGDPIVLWGRSLGSGPATYVASERKADALLLETPFDSAVAVAHDRYPMFPIDWLMLDQYHVDDWIKTVQEPVMVAHGTADKTIGVAHGQRVYDLAPVKDDLWIVDGADHDDLWKAGLWARAKLFLTRAEMRAHPQG